MQVEMTPTKFLRILETRNKERYLAVTKGNHRLFAMSTLSDIAFRYPFENFTFYFRDKTILTVPFEMVFGSEDE